jgi:hypothetical protein
LHTKRQKYFLKRDLPSRNAKMRLVGCAHAFMGTRAVKTSCIYNLILAMITVAYGTHVL